MTHVSRLSAAAAVILAFAGSALAGPVSDFETALRSAYADYRAALFQTNVDKPEAASDTLGAFRHKWSALVAANPEPPPQYADDPAYAATLAKVSTIADTAAAEIASGKLTQAHDTLEAIRDEIGGLHVRNGIVGISDRMNAYHARMEAVLTADYGAFDAAGLRRLGEDAAVLAYLAADIAAHPPAEATDPAWHSLLAGMIDSVTALSSAAHGGDPAAAKAALGHLKAPYSKLYLKFG
jgi:hypothetical protein